MPGGNITQVERNKRMMDIKALVDEGKKPSEIATIMDMPVQTVNRNIKYLENLLVADLAPEVIAEKRQEIYTELLELTSEARQTFIDNKQTDPKVAKQFLDSWMESLMKRAELYGLHNINNETNINFNTQNNHMSVPDVLPREAQEKLSKMIIAEHEKKLKDNL